MRQRRVRKTLFKSILFLQIIVSAVWGFGTSNLLSIRAEGIQSNVDVVFVLDASLSMVKSDKNEARYEAIKMFIDMCKIQGDRASLVAFSEKIVRESKLTSISSAQEKSNFKGLLTGIEHGSKTDIGMGLKRAVDILDAENDKSKQPLIILLSDGQNDPLRDKRLSDADIKAAVDTAREKKYPIYTIGLNYDGTVNKSQMESIAKDTSGVCQITTAASDLAKIFEDFFAKISNQTSTGTSSKASGDFQDITIGIPETNAAEATINLRSNSKLEVKVYEPSGKEITQDSGKLAITPSQNYTVVKLMNPVKGDWKLQIKGAAGEKIETSLIISRDLNLDVKLPPEGEFHKGDKVKVNASLSGNSGKIEAAAFYGNVKASLVIKKPGDSNFKEVRVPLAFRNNSLEGECQLPERGAYELLIEVEVPEVPKKTKTFNINSVNRKPETVGKPERLKLAPGARAKVIYVSQYFKDSDGDALTYSVKPGDGAVVNSAITGESLSITSLKKGKTQVTVTADDKNGGTANQVVEVQVTSKFYKLITEMYVIFILAAVIILSAILLIRTELKLRKFK